MFKFLKDKLKKAVSKFSKDVEEEADDVPEEIPEGVEVEPEPIVEEKEEEKPPEPEMGAELLGLKESLESYSDEEIDSIMNILGFPAKAKKKSRDDKVKDILLKPLLEVNSAIEKLGRGKRRGTRGRERDRRNRRGERGDKRRRASRGDKRRG